MTTTKSTHTKKELPTLPESAVKKLKTLRFDRPAEFNAMVKSLRLNNWPLRAIAEPLGVSRTAVADWENAVPQGTPLPQTDPLPKIEKSLRPMYQPYEIPEDEAKRLWDLAREASKVRRYTDYNSASRVAARELETLLHFYQEKGASLSVLAEVCGVTRRAIAQRLEKEPDADVLVAS